MKSTVPTIILLTILLYIPLAAAWLTVPVRNPENLDQRNRPPIPLEDEIASQRNRPSDDVLEPVLPAPDGTATVVPRGLKHGHHAHRHPHFSTARGRSAWKGHRA